MRKYVFITCMLVIWVLQSCMVLINPKITMLVKDADGNTIENNTGVYDFSNVSMNSSSTATFTIENTGKKRLTLTNSPSVNITGHDYAYFSITDNPDLSIKSGKSTTFSIKFTPVGLGNYTTTIKILNDSDNANPYTFYIAAKCVKPEMLVKQGAATIPSGSGIYDFGNVHYSKNSAAVVFDITNIGSGELILDGNPKIEITGNDSAMFELNQSSVESPIGKDELTSFTLTFKPTSEGQKIAYISINSNDPIHNTYAFMIRGTCLIPDIRIQQENVDILNGSGSYNFGILPIRQSSDEIIFTIGNTGFGDLYLTGTPMIEVSGSDSSMFVVNTTNTSSTITQGNETTFAIKFTPTSVGQKSALITIVSNDPDENPYTFVVNGSGTMYCWTKQISPVDSHTDGDSMSLDSAGNLYITGRFRSTIDFGADFGATDVKTANYSACFITKINANDTYAWTKQLGGTTYGLAIGSDIKIDSAGNIYVIGSFGHSVDFGADFGVSDVKTTTYGGSFITKISSSGTYLWTKTFISNDSYIHAESLTLDLSENLYITGHFYYDSVDFGSDFGVSDVKQSSGRSDIFITKITKNAVYNWTKTISGAKDVSLPKTIMDKSGNFFITGVYAGSVNFGSDFGQSDIKTALGKKDVFVTKINSNGTYGWTKSIGSYEGDGVCSIALDSSSNIYIAGSFVTNVEFAVDFGGSDLRSSQGARDAYITKINANGTYGWTKTFGGIENDEPYSMSIDSSDNIFIVGTFRQTVNFGRDFGASDSKTATSPYEVFITMIKTSGSYGWTHTISVDISPNAVLTNTSGDVFILGKFKDTVDFAADFGTTDSKTPKGDADVFLTKLSY